MSIIAAIITRAEQHPNADKLRVYLVEAPGLDATQIIANTTTIYSVGDVVAAALEGTVLPDAEKGTITIRRDKLRGVASSGMLLGKVTDSAGTDLTARFNATHVEKKVDESNGVIEDANWQRYTSIEGYLRLQDEILAVPEVVVTEKLHGSNFRVGFHGSRPFVVGTHGARILDSRMTAESWPNGHLVRKSLEWVEKHDVQSRVAKFREANPNVKSLAIYGEICGFKCSDLHYGQEDSQVLLFGEVCVDGRFLDYDNAINVLERMFPERPLSEWMVPVLYRGKPDKAILKRLRDQPSALAALRGVQQISEGVVVRPTTEAYSKVLTARLIAKYKSPLYEERKTLRDADLDTLPVYISAYDLIADFVTDERIRHVIARAESSGMVIEKKRMRDLAGLLYEDIRKESIGEWPANLPEAEATLRKWTFNLAGEALSRLLADKG